MNRKLLCALTIVIILLSAIERVVPMPTVAISSIAAPIEVGVYTEDFTTYAAKDYTENTDWNIWTQSIQLLGPDTVTQSSPRVATDENQNIYIVWVEYRASGTDIYISKTDALGNKQWQTAERVNSTSETADNDWPAIAIDPLGDVWIAWIKNDHNRCGVYVQILNETGNKQWSTERLVNSAGAYPTCNPVDMVASRNGTVFVVWEDVRNGNYDIYAQKLDRFGNRLWVNDIRVNTDITTALQGGPAVVANQQGDYIIVWRDLRSGHGDIYAQKMGGNGTALWMTDVRINSDEGMAGGTDIAIDRNGLAIVVWTDSRNTKTAIYAQVLDMSGNKILAGDAHVSRDNHTSEQEGPAVAALGDGEFIVGWRDYREGLWNLYAQELSWEGNQLWSNDVRVSAGGIKWPAEPDLVVNTQDNAIFAWSDSRGGGSDIYMQGLNSVGASAWPIDVWISPADGSADQWWQTAAIDRDGRIFMAWIDTRNGDRDVYAQKLDWNGNRLWTADIPLTGNDSAGDQGAPFLSVDGNGNALIVWWDNRSGTGDIYAQKLDSAGNRLWGTDVLVDYGGYDPIVALDGSGNATIVWLEYAGSDNGINKWNILARKVDTTGERLGTVLRINSIYGTAAAYSPEAATDGSGDTVVLWTDQTGLGTCAQKIDASGTKVWTQEVCLGPVSHSLFERAHVVAMDGSGEALIVWQALDGLDRNIYAQRLDSDGNRLWVENVRINTDSGSAEQNGLAAAMDAGGNAVIVWADYRNGNADIYAQRLNTSGEQLWPADVHINSDMGAARQTAPTVVVNRNGNAFMMWEDRRNGNRDVYAQGINTVGNKSWLTDLQVVYPDHFYTAVGTAQSLTIDTLSANIHEATLTCNHQANGGDVQFFLTNNGGTDWFTVTPGVTHVFTTTGSDLRWRAELTADPLWPRTPVVNSLRIEYSTQVPYADDYEPDDACSQARPIAVNGAAQSHTFHQNADADWAWFDAVAGATYIVETRNISAHANTVIEPRPTCTAPPAGGGRSFGNGYTISFTAPATGRYYLKVYNHDPAVSGQGTDYTLSVRASRPAAVAVIVAGHDGLNSAQENITFAADRAYRIFRNAGIPIANIRYLAPQTGHDADGDGANDIAGPPTVANVRAAVQDWARERGVALGVPFYLYLVDHGLVDRFKADGDVAANQITAADLNLWLSNLEATTGTDNINVIVDACYSGSFIDETTPGPATVSGRNRVIVASTTSDWMAYGPADGQGLYFSNAFFGALENQQSLWASFQAGSQAVEAQGMLQRPWLDDNGDRRFSSDDGTLATGRALRRVALGGQAPRIEWVSADGRTGLVRAKITDDSGWVGVKVEVFAPSYVPPQPDGNGTTRLINVPVVTLVDLDGDGVYEGRYTFVETGQYRLVAHAEDSEGNLALPMTAFAASDRDHRPVFLPLIPRGH